MDQPRRTLFTLLLAVPLLVIPAALALNYTLGAGADPMAGMPGMAGGAPPTATPAAPPGAGYGEITPDELRRVLGIKDFVLFNVHTPYEGEIAGTDAFIPYDQIGAAAARLPADRATAIVLYCRTGRMSAEAAATLARLGYRNVRQLTGGMDAWRASGYPLQVAARP